MVFYFSKKVGCTNQKKKTKLQQFLPKYLSRLFSISGQTSLVIEYCIDLLALQ